MCDFGSCTTKMVVQVTQENRALIEDDIQVCALIIVRRRILTVRSAIQRRRTVPPKWLICIAACPSQRKAIYGYVLSLDTLFVVVAYSGHVFQALGCLLYKMCYRRDAFEGVLQINAGSISFPSRSDYSPEIERIIRAFVLFCVDVVCLLVYGGPLGMCLVRDPRKRPDIFAVLDKVSSVTGIPVTVCFLLTAIALSYFTGTGQARTAAVAGAQEQRVASCVDESGPRWAERAHVSA